MLSSFAFSENTVGFILDGMVNDITINRLKVMVEEKFGQFDKINLYLEDSNVEEFTLSAILLEISHKIENLNKFHKVALVSDRKWIHLCGAAENFFALGEIRSFSTDDRLEALSWIGA